MQQNLIFTTNSVVHDAFLIGGNQTKLKPDNGYFDYVLRVTLSGFKNNNKWHFEFEDADDVGIKKIGRNFYSLRVKQGEEKKVRIEFRGALMPGTSKKYSVPATAGGALLSPSSGTAPVEVPVKPNEVISLVARRLIKLGANDPFNDANGVQQVSEISNEQKRNAICVDCGGHSLLKDGYYRSSDHVGALIGSFDGFKTSFVVGTDSTVIVPANATTLSLAINDSAGQYGDNTGNFQVNVASSDPLIFPTAVTQLPTADQGIPVQAAAGSGLPKLNIDVMQSIPQKKLLIPVGYVSWAIYDTHERYPFWWLWPGNW
jgi:hypothetical protein